ncbi:unnamed protein product, partial [marine sediment metagenome]
MKILLNIIFVYNFYDIAGWEMEYLQGVDSTVR